VLFYFRTLTKRQMHSRADSGRACCVFVLALICACSTADLLAGRQIRPSAFHIAIIDGEGALNNIEGRVAREPIVQVEDENHKPVVGAYVAFDTPATGPGALFANGSTHFVATTDASGRAFARGLSNNGQPGQFPIQVHVSYQGQSIGEAVVHQVNVCGRVAKISPSLNRNLPPGKDGDPPPAGVLGMAVGNNLLVNGSPVPGNANLMDGTQLQTLADPVRVFLGGSCEFLLAPHSAVTVGANQLSLAKGVVRGEPFGNCSVASNGTKAAGTSATSQGLVRLNNGKLEVASIDGSIKVTDAQNRERGTVAACSATAFLLLGGASGATAGVAGAASSKALLYGVLAGSLAGLGIAVDAITQSSPTSP
jgi:hypothetical protein